MRVLILRDAKPRTALIARRRDGDIAPYRNGTAPRGTGGAHGDGARGVRDAKPHTAVASRHGRWRRDGDIAPFRNGTVQ